MQETQPLRISGITQPRKSACSCARQIACSSIGVLVNWRACQAPYSLVSVLQELESRCAETAQHLLELVAREVAVYEIALVSQQIGHV